MNDAAQGPPDRPRLWDRQGPPGLYRQHGRVECRTHLSDPRRTRQPALVLVEFAAIMFFGAALPLLLLGLLSREAMMRWRNRLMSAGQFAKTGLGILFIAIGVLVLTGLDKSIEAMLVAASPQWLNDVTTRF